MVDSPTHFTTDSHCSLIDLIFVSNMHFFSNCSTIPQLSNLDHLRLSLLMKHCNAPSVSHPRRTVWRYNLADFDRANELLCELEIDELLDPASIQRSWVNLKTAFLDVMEQCIPKSVLPQKQSLPWLTKEIIQLIKKRNYFYKEARRSGKNDDFLKFKQLRNKVVAELRGAKQKFFLDLQSQDSNSFWKKLRQLNPNECTIPTLTKGSVVACTNSEKANLLNASFINSFNVAIPELGIEDIPETPCDVCPDELLCIEEEVYNMLRTLDVSKSNGHDDISARMLKETALSMTSIVTQLFNISIKLGELPDEWKVARVSPIPN